MSGANTYTGATLETGSLDLSFLNIDASGQLLKVSQMMKIYSRFRFIDINYGPYLGAYFESSASKFDPPSNKTEDELLRQNRKYYGNLLRGKVALDIYEISFIKIMVYWASWLLKIFANLILWQARRSKKNLKGFAYFIYYS
jgi:hypothetical protein